MSLGSNDISYRSFAFGFIFSSSLWGLRFYLNSNHLIKKQKDCDIDEHKSHHSSKGNADNISLKGLQKRKIYIPLDVLREEKCDNDQDESLRNTPYDTCNLKTINCRESLFLRSLSLSVWKIRKYSAEIISTKNLRWLWKSISLKIINDKSCMAAHDFESDLTTQSSNKGFQTRSMATEGEQDEYFIGNQPSGNNVHSSEEKSGLCIGSIFGLDVGGTLSKLVYFQQTSQNQDQQNSGKDKYTFDKNQHIFDCGPSEQNFSFREQPDSLRNALNKLKKQSYSSDDLALSFLPEYPISSNNKSWTSDSLPGETSYRLKRTKSMFEISQTKHEQRAEALDQFYTLARRLDTHDDSGLMENSLSFYSPSLGGEFHFLRFETRYMEEAMKLIRSHSLHLNIVQMGATGGGAHKYAESLKQTLGIQLAKKGELDSLVAGMQFATSDVDGECYTFELNENFSVKHKATVALGHVEENSLGDDKTESHEKSKSLCSDENFWTRKVKRDTVEKKDTYPYLIVNMGTGVSILRVDGPRKHERVTGSTIGGGTYWGLCRLLTKAKDYESVLNLAERGKNSRVDMLVGDIYGKKVDTFEKLGLTPDVVAASLGKLVSKQDPAAGLKPEDLARALLLMVTNNIGQVAYLSAKLHNTTRIYFVGNFLRQNVISQQRLAYAINYWSSGKMEALFLEHEGYFGALGSFLLHQGILHHRIKEAPKRHTGIRRKRAEAITKRMRSSSF